MTAISVLLFSMASRPPMAISNCTGMSLIACYEHAAECHWCTHGRDKVGKLADNTIFATPACLVKYTRPCCTVSYTVA